MGSQLLACCWLVGYGFSVPTSFPHEPAAFLIRFALLAAGLVLLVMIAPYLKKGEVNGFWQYNKTLFFRLFVTAIFSMVLFAGLAIALPHWITLFGVSVSRQAIWGTLGAWWLDCSPLVLPDGVPGRSLKAWIKVEEYPIGLKIFAQYILAIAGDCISDCILYAILSLKILHAVELAEGWVSSLNSWIFGDIDIVVAPDGNPIRDRSGNAWIRAPENGCTLCLSRLFWFCFSR